MMISEKDHKGPKILLIDDDADFHNLVTMQLKGRGMSVRSAFQAEEGIRLAKEWSPDVVLLDVHMPDMNGLDALARIRKEQGSRFLPIMLLTSEKNIETKVRGLGLGADDYVLKPPKLPELVARISAQHRTKKLQDELHRTNQQLKELEALRQSLTRFIVHDLKNCLMVVEMSLTMGKEALTSKTKMREDLPKFLDAGLQKSTQVRNMVEDLLDISRLEEKKLPLELKPCEPAALLEQCRSQQKAYAEMEKARLNVGKPEGGGRALVDERLIQRVLANLLGNAIKFSAPNDKRVEVSARLDRAQREWVVSVQDNGIGIPKDVLPKVFDKFFRVNRPDASEVPGTGLGLTFCRLAVEAHGGRIWAESQPKRGSRFSFTLKSA